MSTGMRLALACLLGALNASVMAGAPRSAFDQALIGREWGEASDARPLLDQCSYLTRFDLQRNQKQLPGLTVHSLICNGRNLILLTSLSDGSSPQILDALTLPRLKPGERLMRPGDCELDGNSDTDFIAVVRFGRRERVNRNTGVRAAWVPDPETGKIQPLSTRHVVCWRPTPP